MQLYCAVAFLHLLSHYLFNVPLSLSFWKENLLDLNQCFFKLLPSPTPPKSMPLRQPLMLIHQGGLSLITCCHSPTLPSCGRTFSVPTYQANLRYWHLTFRLAVLNKGKYLLSEGSQRCQDGYCLPWFNATKFYTRSCSLTVYFLL